MKLKRIKEVETVRKLRERAEGELKIVREIDWGFRTSSIEKALKTRIETLREIEKILGEG